MQFIYLATAVLMACGANADASSAPPAAPPVAPPANAAKGIGAAAPAGKLPTVIAAKCTQAYLPFSEADVAAMSANDTKVATNGNYSTIPTEVACKGPAGTVDTICDISSCGNHPVCNTCVEMTIEGQDKVKTGTTVIPQVTCTNNYLFGNSTDPIKNVCTDGNDKTYTCSGGCTGFTSCQMCVSVDDPALQSLTP
ncbi:hypothetical protein PCANC_03988 [Puccinia coronata f. sp. avenae]|uniref:Hydrophobin n=1 Tax=Puccinia coronata f. sp. avenae TaxID=200324 RepID=A0A2N5TFP7_9BASI|nr:hypothetical protein PCANC_03988 [Puccinia coronata f. sp. avenae]PLW24320.1 hypothetical protein PCASD_06559 [Puccinia coronata f. sp. avenae]PLW49739.1 hypothetical protein PCASD_01566 [Puccinia coronata f. sp. avenae]